MNLGKSGVRTTVGLPGTVLSWLERIRPSERGARLVGWAILLGAVVAIVAALGR